MWEAVKLQEQLEKAKVAIACLGVLCSNIAVFFVRTGFDTSHLIDFDRV